MQHLSSSAAIFSKGTTADQMANQLLSQKPSEEGEETQTHHISHFLFWYICMGEQSVKLMESISGCGKSSACGHNHSW